MCELQAIQRLETLQRVALAITSQHHRQTLLPTIVEQAVALLHAKSGGIYEYRPERGVLEIVADYGRPTSMLGRSLRLGEGMAGRLISGAEPFLITDDYDHSLYRAEVFQQPRPFGAVIEVPLRWDDRPIGVLYVDDQCGRRFTAGDAATLQLLADHAAIALNNANLLAREASQRQQLEALARASSAIMDNLDGLALDERLDLIVQHACTILEAESAGIFLVQQPGTMTLAASFGHRPGGFVKHQQFVLHSRPGLGLTGYIAAQGVLFKAHGEQLRSHPARRGELTHTPSDCCSLLAIPLRRRRGDSDELIGMLRVDNKKDSNGQAQPLVGFSEEDAWILRLFANAAVVAIEDALLVAELSEKSDYLERLIASLPNGVIAIDRQRRVTKFNRQAQRMLQYDSEQVIGRPVDLLYDDPHEPYRVGQQLHSSIDGRLADYETSIRSQHGDRIPIRLAATWLFDAQGRRIGSVGYFEDLRAARETQRRLDLLLKASNIVAEADDFAQGLAQLAEMLVTVLHSSFCRVFLLDETKQYLVTAATYPAPGDSARLDWNPGIGSRTALAEWPSLERQLDQGRPRVLRARSPRARLALREWTRRLELGYDIQSLLVIPLRARERVVGLLDLGEIRPWELAPFTPEMLHLASAIAEQSAVLIDRMRLLREAEHQRMQFAELDNAARQLRAEKEPARLYQTIVRLAIGLADGSAGGLFLNHPHIEEVELVVADDFPPNSIGRRQYHSEGLIGYVARAGHPEIAYNYTYWREHDPLLQAQGFQSLIAVPLRHAGEVEAVLFVAHATQAYHFSNATLEILERFANHASLVLRTARLITREQRAFSHLAILHQMSDHIQGAYDLDMLLHAALTTITAGYGLGFNRAAVFLLDERREVLQGTIGIGHINTSEADQAWAEHFQHGLEDFRRYRELVQHQRLPVTPVGERVRQMQLPLGAIAGDPFARVAQQQKWLIVYPDEFASLPPSFAESLQPTTPLVLVPLIARGTTIGLLIADNKFTRELITHELIDSLLAFANTTAIAIDTYQLMRDTDRARRQLQAFYEASNALVWSDDPTHVLNEIVERARQTAGARGVSLVLFDAREQVQNVYAAGSDMQIDLSQIVRPNGISIEVLRTGEPVLIEDAAAQRGRVNRTLFDRQVAAGLCLPVALKGQRMGVMWVHYDAPRAFPAGEIAAIQLYVDQAAIAYDNASQIDALRRARSAARIVAQVTTLGQLQPTLESIVAGTRSVLGCDAVSLYQFYHERNQLQQPPTTSGLRFPQLISRNDESARAAEQFVLELLDLDHMVLIEDTRSDPRFANRRFTRDEQIASCVVIPLRVGARCVGVMFINYRQQHQFTPDEVTNLEIFAYQAAVAIHNAQLYEQAQRRATTLEALYKAGRAITSMLAEPELLAHLAEQACALMASHGQPATASLIGRVYDEQLVFTAAYPSETLTQLHAEVGTMLDLRREPVGITGRAVRSATSQRIADVRAEPTYIEYLPGTRSELAVPICIRDKVVGVINLEHSAPGVFDEQHQQALELLAAQAAIAIENAQLFQDTRGLHNVTLAAASALQIDDVLRATTISIAKEFRYESVGIHLIDEHSGSLSGPAYYAGSLPRKMNTQIDQGITGRVMRTGRSALVPDVSQDADYIIGAERTHAELCVALKLDHKVIGVINVESAQLNAFGTHDLHQIETIAQQVVARIENARLYTQLERIYTQLEQTKNTLAAHTAVAWMGIISAAWRHAIESHALTIKTEVALVRRQLDSAMRPRLDARLEKISRMADQILQRPMTPPLGGEASESLGVNDFLHERLHQLGQKDQYRTVLFELETRLDPAATVRINREWLRVIVDTLVDNGIDAMRRRRTRRLRVGAAREGDMLVVTVADQGMGIAPDVQQRLFKEHIVKQTGEPGMGMGLLLAQLIAQTYGGEIAIVATGPRGTTMCIRLPAET